MLYPGFLTELKLRVEFHSIIISIICFYLERLRTQLLKCTHEISQVENFGRKISAVHQDKEMLVILRSEFSIK